MADNRRDADEIAAETAKIVDALLTEDWIQQMPEWMVREIRTTTRPWMELAALCDAAHGNEALTRFCVAMYAISAFYTDLIREAEREGQARGYRLGAVFERRLHQYAVEAGICHERRRACAERNEPVPEWVLAAEEKIDTNYWQMHREGAAVHEALIAEGRIADGPVH